MRAVGSASRDEDNDVQALPATATATATATAKPKVELKPDPVPTVEPRTCFTLGDLGNALGLGLLSSLFPLCGQRAPTESGAEDASRRFGI